MENKLTRILMAIWSVLAIAAFVCAFFTTPLVAKIVGLVFGVNNLMIIGGLIYSRILEKRLLKAAKAEEEAAE